MRIKYSYFHHLAFGMAFLLLCAVNSLKIAGILSSILMFIYMYCSVSVWKETIFLKYMFVTFTVAFLILGMLVCEYGNLWLGEIGETTYYSGALPVLLFYYWLLVNVIFIFDRHWEKVTKKGEIQFKITDGLTTNSMIGKMPVFVFIFNLALFLSVLRTPFFLVGAANRFEYQALHLSTTVNLLKILPYLFNAILIMPIVQDSLVGKIRLRHLFSRLLLPNIPYFLFMVWTGNKFGSFWEALCVILIPVFSILNLKKINIGKLIRTVILLLIVFIGILYLFYNLLGMDISESSIAILLRTGCQGELWWCAYDNVSRHGIQMQEFGKELSYIADSFVTEGASKTYGIYHLMNLFGDKTIVETYLWQMGIRFSACGIELPYLSFGFLSLPVMALIYGNLYAIFINIFVNAVKEKRIIGCIAAGRMVTVTQSAMMQGDWYAYTSLIPLFCLSVIIITYLVPFKRLMSRENTKRVTTTDL